MTERAPSNEAPPPSVEEKRQRRKEELDNEYEWDKILKYCERDRENRPNYVASKFEKGSKLTALEIRAVRFAYCSLGWNSQRIGHAMGRSGRVIINIIDRYGLEDLRRKIDRMLVSKAVRGMEKRVESVVGLTTQALERYLQNAIRADTPFTAKDAKLISDIGANFHRILQLVKNKPTNINKSLVEMSDKGAIEALVSVLKRMKDDPMADMPEVLKKLGLSPDALDRMEEGEPKDPFDA